MTKATLLGTSTFLGLAIALTFAATAQPPAHPLPKVAKPTVNAPVTLIDSGDRWTLDNGIVKLTILKKNGNPTSLVYNGVEILTHGPSYWEQVPSGTVTASVTIDPATNGGERAEVSVKGVNPGNPNAPSPPGGPQARLGAPQGAPAGPGGPGPVSYTHLRRGCRRG